MLAIENLNDLTYLHNVISETLRIQPSVDSSSGTVLTEETKLGEYTFRTDSIILINIYQLHHNEKEWQQHDKFIPERFDPSSEFYLTSSGTKRHPMSYGPFLGGKRICLGKTFAENIQSILKISQKYFFKLLNLFNHAKTNIFNQLVLCLKFNV